MRRRRTMRYARPYVTLIALLVRLDNSNLINYAGAFQSSGRHHYNRGVFPQLDDSIAATIQQPTLLWSSNDGEGLRSFRGALEWFKDQPLDSYLPKQDALAIIDELLLSQDLSGPETTSLIDDSERLLDENWEKIEARLLEEPRSLSEILGKETTDQILKSVGDIDAYDDGVVTAFLESEAVNRLFGKVLYDGIFQFFQQIDVFGNIIGRLPIIGPIRNQIRDETKRNLDRTVGPLIQTFLREYTKIAVRGASDFILSPANRKAFSSANMNLVSNVLDRPVNTLIPPLSSVSKQSKVEVFDYLRSMSTTASSVRERVEKYTSVAYDLLGDKSASSFVDLDRIIDASPTLQKTIDSLWEKAVLRDTEPQKQD